MANIQLLGLDEARRALRSLGRERMNIAIAAGLNRTAIQMQRRSVMDMSRALDRPTPFTLNAPRVLRADRNRLSAKLYIQPIQARYLRYAIRGGTLPTLLEPIEVRLDRHGNIRGKRKGMDAIARQGRRRFVATINGTTGVWQRHGPRARKLKLLVKASENVRRTPRWDFFASAERVARDRLQRDIRDAIARELKAL